MSKYFVSHQDQQMGPYGLDDIVSMVKAGKLTPMDYIYDPEKEDWILFIEHPGLKGQVQKAPHAAPKTSPTKASMTESVPAVSAKKVSAAALEDTEWFVLKGENKFGPFAYLEVVKMLQEKTLYEFDYVYNNNMPNWLRVAECPEFSADKVKSLSNSSNSNIKDVFFRRRHKRVSYNGSLIIHDNNSVWRGKAMEISEGGAGVLMENATLLPGQKLYLHFKPGDGVPHFNAVCEVVSKQYQSDVKDVHSSVKYGLRFLTVTTETEKLLKDYTKESKAAA